MRTKMTNRPGLAVLLAAFFLILSITGGCSTAKPTQANAKGASPKEAAVPVHVFSVASREIRRTVDAVGTLFPYDEVVVSSEVDGRAEKVLVDVGDKVTKGQTLVEILPIEFKLSAQQQAAMVEQAKARLGLNDTDADSGDPTKAAEVKKAAADLANAKQKFDRTKEL